MVSPLTINNAMYPLQIVGDSLRLLQRCTRVAKPLNLSRPTEQRYFSSSSSSFQKKLTEKEKLQAITALKSILRMRKAVHVLASVAKTYTSHKHRGFVDFESRKLQYTLERLQKNYALDLNHVHEEVGDCEIYLSEDDEFEVDGSNGSGKSKIFSLNKKTAPKCPDGTILSYYESSLSEMKSFAKSHGVKIRNKKFEVWRDIIEAFSLSEESICITDSDIRKSIHSLSHIWLQCKQREMDTRLNLESKINETSITNDLSKYQLKIQYPTESIPDGLLPISPFIYISTIDDAKLILALLSNDESIEWRLEKSDESNVIERELTLRDVHVGYEQNGCLLSPLEGNTIGVNIETTGIDPYTSNLRLITLSWPQFPSLIFDVKKLWGWNEESILPKFHDGNIVSIYGTQHLIDYEFGTNNGTGGNDTSMEGDEQKCLIKLWVTLKSIFENSKITKVFFNGKFSYKFLRLHFGTTISYPLKDTFLDSYLYEAGLDYQVSDLNSVVENYLLFVLKLPKTLLQESSTFWTYENLSNDQLLHTGRNAAVLSHLSNSLTMLLNQKGLAKVSELEARCMRSVGEIELNGILLDQEMYQRIREEVENRILNDGDKLIDALGWTSEKDKEKNINSPSQVLNALRERGVSIAVERSIYETVDRTIATIDVPSTPPTFFNEQRNDSNLEGEKSSKDENDNDDEKSSTDIPENRNQLNQIVYAAKIEKGTELIPNTSSKTLKTVVNGTEIVDALLTYRQSKKLESAFINSMFSWVNPKTGRIHSQLNQTGTSSGRFSCCNPNLQQVPRDPRFRKCFVAPNGYKFVIVDLSQIELRIAADLAPDFLMIEAFSQGHDLHRLTASLLRGVPMDQVTKADRQMAKAVNFGLIYGISPKGLREYAKCSYGVEMSLTEAGIFRSKYFEHYEGIAQWHRGVRNRSRSASHEIYESGNDLEETRTRSQRRALFTKSHGQFQRLLNYPVQGTAADMIKEALGRLIDLLPQVEGRLIHCIHDEIIVEVPEKYAEEAKTLVVKTMEDSGNYYFKQVQCIAEGAVGNSWSEKP